MNLPIIAGLSVILTSSALAGFLLLQPFTWLNTGLVVLCCLAITGAGLGIPATKE